MRMILHAAPSRHVSCARKKRAVAASPATMGRPKIEGLVPFNLRILKDQRDALVRICESERARRGDPGLTVTDLVREALAAFVRDHSAKARK